MKILKECRRYTPGQKFANSVFLIGFHCKKLEQSNFAKQTKLNDLRPIALTSVLMKSLERIILSLFLPRVQPHLDPHQFAYRSKRGVEDAIVLFTHNIYKHLDKPKAYVRTMFIDFSSAFNTIQPHLLIPKLRDYGVCETISAWIFEFLTTRPQFVTVKTDSNCYKSGHGPVACLVFNLHKRLSITKRQHTYH